MVQEIKILNAENNKMVTVGASGVYILDNIEWDSPAVSSNTYRVPFQIGESLESIAVGTRKPTIRGYVISDVIPNIIGMPVDEYYRKQEESIIENKKYLDDVINVFQDVIIEANGYRIKARPETPPKYSAEMKENNEVLCLFSISISCYDPLFYKSTKQYQLSSVEGMFHFPLIIPEDEGIVMGVIKSSNVAHIVNEGQSEIGMTITISALSGSVINPEIRNVHTQDFFKIEDTIEKGNTLTIITNIGEENVMMHNAVTGQDITYVGSVSYDSTFLKVPMGESVYTINADSGTTANAQVEITINEKYFNFDGM